MSLSGIGKPEPLKLGVLADRLGLILHGDPDICIESAATLRDARPGQISFLANPAYADALTRTAASAVIVSDSARQRCRCAALVAEHPYAAWARLLECLYPQLPVRPGIAVNASVDESARIDAAAEIGPLCRIGADVRIGAGVVVGPGCVVGDGVSIGRDCRLGGNVVVGGGACLGERVLIHPGAVIGADGFGMAMLDGRWLKVAQIGSVRIGDDCEIGANTTIDRGAIGDTVLGRDVRIDNQVQIAHNVQIGDHSAIAGCVGIAGSTRIGRYCMIAGASGIGGHLEICDHVVITAMSTVLDSIREPGHYGSAIPARPLRAWQRILVRLSRIDQLFKSGLHRSHQAKELKPDE
ncbi:MAG: UDP-3-O-(3-hydroxymyristoyl)glucosamine N-acyltransferase [Wenzhouxiangellaceae bacterium]